MITPGHLAISDVTKSFGRQTVLREFSLQVPAGTTTAVVGPSGSGKTTLLRLVAGFESPESGSISLGDDVVSGPGRWVPAHRRGIGYVAQDGALFPHLSVGDNVAFGFAARWGRRDRPGARRRVAELLAMVSLDPELAARQPHQLSGGQQQRVALARALAREPRLMLLDESFSALDAGLRSATRRTVADALRRTGVTTLLVTHDQGEALSFADQVAVIRAGELSQVDDPVTLYRRPADLATAQFLGGVVVREAVVSDGIATCDLGEIPVPASSPTGRVRVLLRPEQLRIGPDGPIAVVVSSEFFGPETLVRVRLGDAVPGSGDAVPGSGDAAPDTGDDDSGLLDSPTFTVRSSSPTADGLRPGDVLRLRVDGPATVVPPDPRP